MKQGLLSVFSKLIGVLMFIAAAILVITAVIASASSSGGDVLTVSDAEITVNGSTRQQTLPVVLNDLEPGTEVSVAFSVPAGSGDSLFFGSVYAPLTITAENEIIYEYGTSGITLPFLLDPPTVYDSVQLPVNDEGEVSVKMIYLSPHERDTLSIHAPSVGYDRNILRMLMLQNGPQLIVSVLILFLGIILTASSLFFLSLPNRGKAVLYPGLLCIAAGAWQFGENRLAVYLLEMPEALYMLDFCGLFLLAIPLYRMAMFVLDIPDNPILKIFLLIQRLSALAAILLQLFGIVGLHRSLYYFHVLTPVSLLVLVGVCLYYYLRYHSRTAAQFSLPFAILAAAAIIELANYYLRFFPQFSYVFQMGLLLFLLYMAAFSGLFAKHTMQLRFQAMELQNEVVLQEQAINAQKQRNEMLLSHYDEIRKQRHDLRHHLRILSDLLQKGETEKASSYITSLTEATPVYKPEVFCDNAIVNSALCFYAQEARENEIDIKIRTQVPADNSGISDSSLCVVFGNMLENAIEACRQKKDGRFITISSRVSGDMLFITMDNSAAPGSIRTYDGLFASNKGSGRGMGLRSIRSIAERHGGSAEFNAENGVFQSEVCLRLG